MIYTKDINVGDTIYTVETVYNWVNGSQKRLTMIDDEGNEWHRYDKPGVEYHIDTWLVKGKVTQMFEGELPDDEKVSDYSDTIFLESVKTKERNTLIEICGNPIENVYLCIGDAQSAKDKMQKSY